MDFLTLITQMHASTDESGLFTVLEHFVRPLGFDSVIFCLMTDHATIGEPAKHGKIVGYPDDWMKHYMANDYEVFDPIRQESLLQPQSVFTWEGIARLRPYSKVESRLMHEAYDAGLKDGVTVALKNSHDECVAFGYASTRGGVEMSNVTVSLLKLASVQFYDCYQSLKARQIPGMRPSRVRLTDREREVLQWTAAGKSIPDIATILGITDATVKYFLQRCFGKLNANSKTLAVVKAMRLGLIKLDSEFVIPPTIQLA